jgi:hypothetical protein
MCVTVCNPSLLGGSPECLSPATLPALLTFALPGERLCCVSTGEVGRQLPQAATTAMQLGLAGCMKGAVRDIVLD